jgi:hypothetical protein
MGCSNFQVDPWLARMASACGVHDQQFNQPGEAAYTSHSEQLARRNVDGDVASLPDKCEV